MGDFSNARLAEQVKKCLEVLSGIKSRSDLTDDASRRPLTESGRRVVRLALSSRLE